MQILVLHCSPHSIHSGNSGSSTNFLLDEFTIDGLDTLSVGDNEVVYHVGFGLNYTPKYIAADGSFTKAGRVSTSEKTLTGVELHQPIN